MEEYVVTLYGNKNTSYTIKAENYEDAYRYCLLCGYNRFSITSKKEEQKNF